MDVIQKKMNQFRIQLISHIQTMTPMTDILVHTFSRAFRTEVKYNHNLTQDILDWIYVTVLNKRKMNGPPKFMPPMWISDRSPRPHTTLQRKNVPNCHFNLGIVSADEPPAPHYKNSPQVFQSSQQTFTMELHHPSHYLFYQILSWRLWKNMNQEVCLRHLPHLLSQSFRLSCPIDDEVILPVSRH